MNNEPTLEETVLKKFGVPYSNGKLGYGEEWRVDVSERRNCMDIHPFLNTIGNKVSIYVWVDETVAYVGLIIDDVKQSLGEIPLADFNSAVVSTIVSSYVLGVIAMKKKIRELVNWG